MRKMNLSETPPVDPSNPEIRLVEAVGLKAALRDNQISVAMTTMQAGAAGQRHLHRYSKEIYIILSGSAQLIVDEDFVSISRSDVILIEPGEKHAVLARDEAIEFLAITLPAYSPEDFIPV